MAGIDRSIFLMSIPYDIRPIIDAIHHTTNARLARVKQRNLGRLAEEVALREADEACRALRQATISFETATPVTPATVHRPEHLYQVVRVRGMLAQWAEPTMVSIPRETGTLTDLLGERADEADNPTITSLSSTVLIAGVEQGSMRTQPFMDRQLVKRLQEDGSRYANWEFLVLVVPSSDHPAGPTSTGASRAEKTGTSAMPGETRTFLFFLIDARPLTKPLQVVHPTPGEITAAIERFGQDPTPLATGTDLLVQYLDIHHLDQLPILREALTFQVLAAATEDRRAHTLVLGPAGVGKSSVHKAARLLQPCFQSALPTKITEAGLIGDGHSSAKERRPGLIPQAHTGAFSIEDVNQANQVKNQRVMSTITHVMAERVVMDASAARATYSASVSIILDANRKSDMRQTASALTGLPRLVQDTGIPMNVLSRITYIAEIPRDPRTQIQVAQDIIASRGARAATDTEVLRQQLRLLQVYLAAMRDRHPRIDIPAPVRTQLQQMLLAAQNTTTERFEQHPEFADFITRQGEQALLMVEAHARLCNRSEATITDIEAIFPFIWRKLDWLKNLLFDGQTETRVVEANALARRMMIRLGAQTRLRLGKTTWTARELQRQMGLLSASLDTLTEDLHVLFGEPDATGRFTTRLTPAPGNLTQDGDPALDQPHQDQGAHVA